MVDRPKTGQPAGATWQRCAVSREQCGKYNPFKHGTADYKVEVSVDNLPRNVSSPRKPFRFGRGRQRITEDFKGD